MRKILYVLTFAWYTLYSSKSHQISGYDTPEEEFSTLRALEHVKIFPKNHIIWAV